MKAITKDFLLACKVSAVKANTYAPIISAFAEDFGINNRLRVCHFFGQILHESCLLRYTEEIATGAKYEGRRDLGNTHAGDGKKYKGRGLLQITGRYNYAELTTAFKADQVDFLQNPEVLSEPIWAVKSAMWWWCKHDLNRRADENDIQRITKTINGGYNGITSRKYYFNQACNAWAKFM